MTYRPSGNDALALPKSVIARVQVGGVHFVRYFALLSSNVDSLKHWLGRTPAIIINESLCCANNNIYPFLFGKTEIRALETNSVNLMWFQISTAQCV